MTPLYGITRYTYHRTCGWLARYYAPEGQVYTRLFSDSYFGWDAGRSQAAAQQFLLHTLLQAEPRPRYRTHPSSTNTSGRIGVSLTIRRYCSGARVPAYSVNYTLEGHRKTKVFLVHHFTSQQAAFHAACTFRETMEQAMQHERRDTLQQTWAMTPVHREHEVKENITPFYGPCGSQNDSNL